MPVTPKLFRGAAADAGKVCVINAVGEAEFQTLSGDATISSAGVVAVAADATDLALTTGSMLIGAAGVSAEIVVKTAGSILVGNGTTAALTDFKTAGQVLVGNGTTAISSALSGDVASVSGAGAVALANPQKLLSTTVNLTEALIVGNSAGDLGHAAGVELVAAVASKIIQVEAIVINFTYATAAYTDGGNVYAIYGSGGAAATGVAAAASGIGAGSSNINLLRPLSGLALVNTPIALFAAAAFTQPGTAAGTAVVKTYYRLIDA